MSLPAMTFGGRFSFNRKGGTGEGGWVHLKGVDGMAVSGLRFRNTLVCSGWATVVLLCMNSLRKQSYRPAQHHFPAGKPLSQSGQVVTG